MSENTRICALCCSPPEIATNSSQLTNTINQNTAYIFSSTLTATAPNYRPFQLLSESVRLQIKMGKLRVGC
jgi:hypothetical protein